MFCQVIVDINHEDVDRVFTYRVPKGMTLCPGMRVHVPFGPRKLEGVVVEMVQECDLPPERVKDVADIFEKERPAWTVEREHFAIAAYFISRTG